MSYRFWMGLSKWRQTRRSQQLACNTALQSLNDVHWWNPWTRSSILQQAVERSNNVRTLTVICPLSTLSQSIRVTAVCVSAGGLEDCMPAVDVSWRVLNLTSTAFSTKHRNSNKKLTSTESQIIRIMCLFLSRPWYDALIDTTLSLSCLHNHLETFPFS